MNRFDKPVEGQYVSQYVPIPFEQLYQLGKYYNEEVDKARQELASSVNKWSEFRSPSAIDTKQWYDYTIGGAKQIVDDMVNNPDLIKTAEGRSRITSFINSRPYDKLSSLQQSREAMLERQKANQTLALNGKYNPLWHDVNFTDYNTMQGGIFKDTAPLAFKSVRDLTEPYVNDLKDEYITSKGGYDYFGVTKKRALEQVNQNWSSIYNTPEAQKHIQTLMGQGLDFNSAVSTFKNMVDTAAGEYSRVNRNANEFAKIGEEYRQRANLERSKQADSQQNRPFLLTQAMEATGLSKFQDYKTKYLSSTNPEYNKLLNQYAQAKTDQEKNIIRSAMSNMEKEFNPTTAFRSIMNKYGSKNAKGGFSLTNIGLGKAVNEVLNEFAYSPDAQVKDIFKASIDGFSPDKEETAFGKRHIINGGENLTLTSRYIANVAGFSATDSGRNKVENALKSGKLSNMIVLDNNKALSIPSGRGVTSVQNVKVAIPKSLFDREGINEGEIQRAGGVYYANPSYRKQNISSSYKAGSEEPDKRNVNEKLSGEEGYYILNLAGNLPSTGEGMNAETMNQEYQRQQIGASASSDYFPNTQNVSWGFDNN